MTIDLLKGLCGKPDKDTITRYHYDEPFLGILSVSVFASGHGVHFISSLTIMPAENPDCNGSLSSAYRNRLRSLSCQLSFCCYPESSIFGHYNLQDVISTASSYVERDQENALVLASRRWEGRVSPAVIINTAVRGLSGTDLRAGEIMAGGEREDWAEAERFQSAETGSASFGSHLDRRSRGS